MIKQTLLLTSLFCSLFWGSVMASEKNSGVLIFEIRGGSYGRPAIYEMTDLGMGPTKVKFRDDHIGPMSKKLERNVRLACDVEYKEISGCNGVLVYHVTKIYLCLNEQEEVALRQESLSAEELLERTTKILELGVGPVATTVKVDRATKERPQYRVSPGIQVSGR